MSGPPDAELIARVLTRDDRHAFEQLVRRHQSPVRNLLRRLTGGDSSLADDLAQESFVLAWRHLPRFKGTARFSTWIHRIAWNVFLSDARCAKLPTMSASTRPAPEPSASAEMDRALARVDLDRALLLLRPEERAAIALTYGQELTHEEAASVLEVPLGTLKTHVLRGRARLQQTLLDPGETEATQAETETKR